MSVENSVPISARKSGPLQRILQNFNVPEKDELDDLEGEILLADLSANANNSAIKKLSKFSSRGIENNDRECAASETSSTENNHQNSTPKGQISKASKDSSENPSDKKVGLAQKNG